ncbi:MAG TPA: APC family permease, partial [Bacillota bacterium]
GWFGILVNLIVCAYEVVSIVRMLEFLIPSVTAVYWYRVLGSPVGLATIAIGIVLVLGITAMHYRGVRLSSAFQNITSTTLMILVAIGVIVAFTMGTFQNFKPYFGKPVWAGIIAVSTMLPFSLAGWETIAKGSEEATREMTGTGKSGRTVPIAWIIGWFAYVATLLATGMVLPWTASAKLDIPFASGLNQLTGSIYPGLLLIVTATIGVIGVYNALFYAVTRQLYGMAQAGMMPSWLARVHPTHKTPVNSILLATLILLIAPFLGRKFLIPLVDAASFAYVVVWGSTFLSVMALARRTARSKNPIARPGGPLLQVLGYVSILFFAIAMLYPKSPGALIWPLEHEILAGLIVLGLILYWLGPRGSTAGRMSPEP